MASAINDLESAAKAQPQITTTVSLPDHPRQDSADTVTDDSSQTATSPSAIASPPPYWPHACVGGHHRSPSSESALPVGAIRLRDNDTHDDERNSACWAKSVEIVDYTVVNGIGPSLGAFVVWNVRVETLSRYSEFDEFRNKLLATFPGFRAAMPQLPPKSLIYRFKHSFLEKRRAGLQYFLNCVMLNPEFSGSPVLREFLFA